MTRKTRLVVLSVLGLGLALSVEAQRIPGYRIVVQRPPTATAFDTSEYRQTTYGAPTHYCDPTRALADNGTGTLGDPWNLTQCQASPVCGNVVGILNVGAGTPVALAAPNNDNEPAFDPSGVTDCTSGNRLVYTARFAAVALSRATITTNQNRSEFRHAGTADAADVVGTGGPMYGSLNHDYVTYDGLFVDMAQAHMTGDSGVIRSELATGVQFRNFMIKGETTDIDSNPVIWRPQQATDTVLSNFIVYDFDNAPTGGGLNQQGLFSDQYGDLNFLIEYFLIDNTDNGLFVKGTASGGTIFNYGEIRYGIVRTTAMCVQWNDLHATSLTTVHHVLCDSPRATSTSGGQPFKMSSETTAARNLLIHHVTVARLAATSSNTIGCFVSDGEGIGAAVTIRDNICDLDSGSFGRQVMFCFESQASCLGEVPATMNYNGYYENGDTETYQLDATVSSTLPDWRTDSGLDANSQEFSATPFVDRANSDFHIAAGHAALTGDTTGGELGVYEGAIDPGPFGSY